MPRLNPAEAETFARVWRRVTGDPDRGPIRCRVPAPVPPSPAPAVPGESPCLFLTLLTVIFILHSQILSN